MFADGEETRRRYPIGCYCGGYRLTAIGTCANMVDSVQTCSFR
jgi:hypothetical protein